MDPKFVAQLLDVSALIQQKETLEEGLRDLARMTAHSLAASRCSVMLLTEDDGERRLRLCSHYGEMPPEAYAEVVPLDQGIAGQVVASGEPLLIEDIGRSPFAGYGRRVPGTGPSLMSAPVPVADTIIGVINVSEPMDRARFSEPDLQLLRVFSLFVGKSIQVFQLQRLAESRVLQMAHALDDRERRGGGERRPISPDPARLAKMVAKAFYRELATAGFGPNAIIAVSSQVLSELNDNLGRHRSRLERRQSDG
jgi:L-methionine (R)-S-oxide reductase